MEVKMILAAFLFHVEQKTLSKYTGRSSAAVVQDKAAQMGKKPTVEITLSPPRVMFL